MGELIVLDGVRTVQLTKGQNALVDEVDYFVVSAKKWGAIPTLQGSFYATHRTKKDRKQIHTYLHRFLKGNPAGMDVDHKNGDRLDCRQENLRVCTRSQNLRNRRTSTGRSGFKGVFLNGKLHQPNPWLARIGAGGGKYIIIGYYSTPEEAARAYDAKAIELFGEFAATNADIFGEVT